MSAPERIWIAGTLDECGSYYPSAVEAEGEHGGFAAEYIRADLHDAAIAKARADAFQAARVAVQIVISRNTPDDGGDADPCLIDQLECVESLIKRAEGQP